jgi:ribosomal protein S18 acetylase RimI-like enzyme
MTTTLRPTEPLQQGPGGARSRRYDVCVNSRTVGRAELAIDQRLGPYVGRIVWLWIDESDRRRGRGCVAALAAEEVLRGWGCRRVGVSVPADAGPALRLASALGYVERSRHLVKPLPAEAPALPAGSAGRPMTQGEYEKWEVREQSTYARLLADGGVPEAEARAKAERDHAVLLSEGLATPETYLGVLTHEEAVVGTLWLTLGDTALGTSGAYVMNVEVAGEHRGRGHGRSLMLLAERVAIEAAEERIGLNVFLGNTPAERLYESLGYQATTHHFFKELI